MYAKFSLGDASVAGEQNAAGTAKRNRSALVVVLLHPTCSRKTKPGGPAKGRWRGVVEGLFKWGDRYFSLGFCRPGNP